VASLIFSLLWLCGLGSLFAVLLGTAARKDIEHTGQGGDGLAVAGIILGVVGLIGAIPFWISFASSMNA
jgi:hypothetical protein